MWLLMIIMSYGCETWPMNAEMMQLISDQLFCNKCLPNHVTNRREEIRDKVWSSVVLDTFLSRQLRHILRSDHALYALYEPTHGKIRRGQPRTNYINYIQKITGHQLSELIEIAQNREDWHQFVVE